MMEAKEFSTVVGGKTVTFGTGKLAAQAGGAVTIRQADTFLLAAATMAKVPREGIDFFPLTVDYEEKLYAGGRIPGSFFRREGRPSEAAILIARLADRPIRPLFPKDLRNDVQVILYTLSSDGSTPLDDLRVAGTKDAVLMVECDASEVEESVLVQAVEAGHRALQPLIAIQEEMGRAAGKPKREYVSLALGDDLRGDVRQWVGSRVRELLDAPHAKAELDEAFEAVENEAVGALCTEGLREEGQGREAFNEIVRAEVRERILSRSLRPDGRGLGDLRPISAEGDLSPRAHGSGLFTRGG